MPNRFLLLLLLYWSTRLSYLSSLFIIIIINFDFIWSYYRTRRWERERKRAREIERRQQGNHGNSQPQHQQQSILNMNVTEQHTGLITHEMFGDSSQPRQCVSVYTCVCERLCSSGFSM